MDHWDYRIRKGPRFIINYNQIRKFEETRPYGLKAGIQRHSDTMIYEN